MAFDIMDVLGTVSKADPGQEQIVYIALDKLDGDPSNFYTLDGIEELADNISLIGLQQPLRIRPGTDGHFIVVSGHRRRAACMLISHGDTENAHMFDKGVPCIIDNDECSPAMRELRLIYANSATRVMTPAEISKQAERIETILYQLSEEGVEFRGRMRDHVAKACAVSKSKIARLHAIRNNLVPGLLEEFDAGRLNESVAYRMSQEKPEVQMELHKKAGISVRGYDINATERAIEQIKNPRPAAAAASHDFQKEWEEDRQRIRDILEEEDEDFFWALAQIKDMFFNDLNCLNSRQEGIEKLKKIFGIEHRGGMRGWGSFDCTPKGLTVGLKSRPNRISRSWTEVYDLLCTLALTESSERVMDQHRTKKPETVSEQNTNSAASTGWSTGEPEEPGEYVVVYGVSKTETESTRSVRTMRWDGEDWINPKTGVMNIDGMNVYRWMKM